MVSMEAIQPDIPLPDSLGGREAKGQIDILTTTSVQGELLGYEIAKIKISFNGAAPVILYSLFDEVTSEKAKADRNKYAPWVASYLTQVKFKTEYDTNYYKFSQTDTLHGGMTIELGPPK